MRLRLTLLGTGSSGGVPRLGPDWGACDPGEPRNRRMRCSALLERLAEDASATSILIDTAPDFHEQALRAGITRLDAVVFTHDHADQAHGIDDLRQVAHIMRARVPVHMDTVTAGVLMRRFDYCFRGSDGYPAILDGHTDIEPGRVLRIDGPGGAVELLALELDHGLIRCIGFRIGPLAYCNDVVSMPEATLSALGGVSVLVVDALRYAPHPTHAHVARALEWIGAVGARHGVLTNLHHDLDYETLRRELPGHVRPAYDGLMIDLDAAGEVSFLTRPGWPEMR